ncbi:hypothetical protein ACPOL_1237 [Acidisarcina polymorpha]|uniref:Uncharacterized protein n=1 Tax=Acidisarcina polymorpha TaxID=2211140 RepID=A0A2Z5FW30_9BACT|nr:hypothetical protein ACPOL_1237 [Acidisarcina polymorpha]
MPLLASLVLSYRASPTTVYVAADSRLTSPASQGVTPPPVDTACKIRVLKGGVVFVGTGNALFSADGVETNIYALAAHAAAALPSRPLEDADIRDIALVWQNLIHGRLQEKLQAGPQNTANTSKVAATAGTTGSFYAATASGDVFAITLRVALDDQGLLRDTEEPQPQPGFLVATGTNIAKQDALELATSSQNVMLPWPRRLQAIELQTIREEAQRYGRGSDIGGRVDMIQITSKGPAWILRKANCR